MGCSNTKPKEEEVQVRRRRLSLGEIDAEPERDTTVNEEDRSMLLQLSQQQILEFVASGKGNNERKYSIGSVTDTGMENVTSFTSKTTQAVGDEFEPKKERLGYACKKGLKPESPNQDSFLILKIDGEYSLYGVFDGHGRKGHDVSNFVKDNLPKVLLSQADLHTNTEKALELAFQKTQVLIEKATNMKKIDALRSGTTASVVFHDHKKGLLYLAHVGDSRVVLGRQHGPEGGAAGSWTSLDLTVDHKPDLPEERARIEKAGGMVVFDGGWNYRVYVKGKRDARGKRYPGLNMSRSMGDVAGFYDAGISATPDVNQLNVAQQQPQQQEAAGASGEGELSGRKLSSISASSKPSISSYSINVQDKFVLLCSDGVWEFISSDEAVTSVATFGQEDAMDAAEHLAGMAWKRWNNEMGGEVVDDITAVVIHLQ